jgi:NAD(P)H dehydrogenase (quinone)
MHVYVVFAHPTRDSFTGKVLNSFLRGLAAGGHTSEIGDLYAIDFRSDLDIGQYRREMGSDRDAPVPHDVEREHRKIARAQALAFIYPVWWSDVPAKLKGWFDRVFAYGYAYARGEGCCSDVGTKLNIEKAIALCPAGMTVEAMDKKNIAQSMKTIMLNDRLGGAGIKHAEMEILGGMTGDDGENEALNLQRAYDAGLHFAATETAGVGPAGEEAAG